MICYVRSLRLGSVNSLGQFVSEFDPDPDGSKKKGKICYSNLSVTVVVIVTVAATVDSLVISPRGLGDVYKRQVYTTDTSQSVHN